MEITNLKFKKYYARDRIVALRISLKEEAVLKNEAKKQEKSISHLIREGFLNKIDPDSSYF